MYCEVIILHGHLVQKDVNIFEKNWPTPFQMAPKLKCAKPPFDKEKKCVRFLWTHTVTTNLMIFMRKWFFKKKAYDDNTLPITHTLF